MNNHLIQTDVPVEREYVDVTEMEASRKVARGDKVNGQTVARVQSGPKWTTLWAEGDRMIARVPAGDAVEVTRTVETEASLDARYRAYQIERLSEYLLDRRASFDKAFTRFQTRVAEEGMPRDEDYRSLLAQQAELRVWDRFAAAVEFLANKDDFEGDLVDARDQFVEHLTKEFLSATRHRSLSRSTSVFSNLMEDLDNEAVAEFIDHANRYL